MVIYPGISGKTEVLNVGAPPGQSGGGIAVGTVAPVFPVLDIQPENFPDDGSGKAIPKPGFKAVTIGISTGGPRTLLNVLPHLPADLNAAVIVVQHMPTAFLTTFTRQLARKTAMPCRESVENMLLEPGNIYIAKGGTHLKLKRNREGALTFHHSIKPKHIFTPSIDVMMSSVCDIFGADTIGVLMTGMGRDGAEGMVKIQRLGGATIAESKETAVVYGMPLEATLRGAAQQVLPNWAIAEEIIKITQATTGTIPGAATTANSKGETS